MASIADAMHPKPQPAATPTGAMPATNTSATSRASKAPSAKSNIDEANSAIRWACVSVAVAAAILVFGSRVLRDVRIA